MKALCWHGTNDIRCDNVPDPKIEDGRDVIIKVTSCAICGSDLHLMDGLMPTMKSGDILGHEFMGEVVETGSAHTKFKKGDRIVVPFNINCGECRQCKLGNYSVCQRSNRNAAMAAAQFGYTTAGLFGYSHLTGGYSGGQAEYVRVPMADVAPMKVPDGMDGRGSALPDRHFPHRLSGRRAGRHQGRRDRGDLGHGSRRSVRDPVRQGSGRRAHHRDRDRAGAHRHGAKGGRHRHRRLRRKRTSTSGSRRSAKAKAPMS